MKFPTENLSRRSQITIQNEYFQNRDCYAVTLCLIRDFQKLKGWTPNIFFSDIGLVLSISLFDNIVLI